MHRAPYASDPAASRGREFPEEREGTRGPRSEFQRDRDRIVHSIAFRRLRSKTQVFIAPDGDHYRTRLTHSIEVAQIGRVLARELGLDEDLTEAICLGHDIGHPPFGHAGETALEEAMVGAGGYDHNAHGLRTLARLESPYCDHDGLNLTWETLEGLAKHNGPVSAPGWALEEIDRAFPLELSTWPSLEAQVAAIADDIAYDNHDIDDGLRAGFLDLDDLLALDWLADQWRAVEKRFPHAPRDRQLRELVRTQIGLMVTDLLTHTREQVKGVGSAAEVRAAGRQLAAFSPAMREHERVLKRFMYDRLYYHEEQMETARRAHDVISRLFAAYHRDPATMPEEWRVSLPESEPQRSRHIADFIAGMTDRFAITQCARIYGSMPEGLSNV
ncbi:MAG: deoxyguanosinetriphosphate triphosphohydrolase [Sphingomonadaceae bacterium]|jgi:dGTPase|uniref:deoxyguanosinetriphosphate triphosphohydrolase n=1 Tax=Erythrobacteraceae TaxID=335929 RepID=UPI0007B9C175|nr:MULTISPECIES: deoxyguanosinetriphosphate triphosphohydrolase [unclassified Erythrobacter]MAC30528.1 deoxyguanosinetriphosphate triphosphohydrolase [Erythrobacter sp.]MAL54524.1 deoxyguanosinetriphosphate triphosphohydrolase [Sphingomonadaceae bacterium]KZX92355.1 deoxyguanosinetriphosphate triphosphohydrolase [Erythrobacter sp. HI0019]KZY00949.1 deoxyguanosinetriphosphate triphosphohydrolase [Erythrobacter sp. HI0028]MAQ31096.1 deoxyguanosinetriphosphate triphosphohydrolase [Erythrobacter s|tara:strand:+ start:1669 stop:2829 length:1161 start_codon:yes stop_codon:yes gene_type:complete